MKKVIRMESGWKLPHIVTPLNELLKKGGAFLGV